MESSKMREQARMGTRTIGRPRVIRALRGALAVWGVMLCSFVLAGAGLAASDTSNSEWARFALPAPKVLEGQTATLLSDGRWLLVGGEQSGVASGTVSITDTSSAALQTPTQTPLLTARLVYSRSGHTATVLPDGTVAVLGGTGADGKPVSAAEILDPQTGETRVIADTGLMSRTAQTATLLTDGEVLLAGGTGSDGQVLSNAELWDPSNSRMQTVVGGLTTARAGQSASLLPDGRVLIWGGHGAGGQAVTAVDLYDPQTGAFTAVDSADDTRLRAVSMAVSAASVEAVLPAANATGVPVDARIAIRLSTPIQLGSALGQIVSVVGSAGAVAGNVVAAEGGKLLFFTPNNDLQPQATYTVFLQGAKDRSGRDFPFSTSSFTTRSFDGNVASTAVSTPPVSSATRQSTHPSTPSSTASVTPQTTPATKTPAQKASNRQDNPPTPDDDSATEDWAPQEKNRHGEWRVLGLKGDPLLGISSLARGSTLTAPAGQTAVAGQVLRYHGKPLAGVAVQLGGQSGVTDSAGRFLLTGVSPGVTQLTVDGTAVVINGRHYTKHFIRVEVAAGKTTAIPNPIYLPRVDPATEVTISSPAAKELVLTHPGIPGLEVHIPKGVVLREYDGKIVTKVSITPVPLDRPPYPTPTRFSVYFTLQPGGAFVSGDATKAIRVIYPNYQGLPPGTRADFWNYDPAMGWQVYGHGTVTANGKQVVPDANVGFRQVISFGMGIGSADGPPAKAPPVGQNCQCGDPVDLPTGLFLHNATDLAIQDLIPIVVSRTYRPNDPTSRAFGIGTNLSYAMWLYTGSTASAPPEIDLVQSDGSKVAYMLQSGTSLSNGLWTNTTTPSAFYGSVLTAFSNSSGEGFTIKLRDRTVLKFAPHSPNGIVSITDPNGNALTFTVTSPTVGGTITRVTSPSGRYVQFSYDGAGRIIQAADNIARTVSYAYDSAGRLSSVTDPNGKVESYAYDSSNRMTSVTDKRGNVMVTNVYDTNGRVSQQTLADGAVWKFAYALDNYGNVAQTSVTDPRGYIRQSLFNSVGYLTQQIVAYGQPEQQTTTIVRDATNLVQSVTDALGRKTTLSYDGFGNVTGITRLAGTANAVTDSFTYDPTTQKPTTHTDPLGHVTTVGYDWLGNLTSVADPLGDTIQVANDAQGKPISITDQLGHVTQLTYSQSDLSAVTDPLGRTVSLFNDSVGRTTGMTDPLGHETRYDYDFLNRVLRITDARGGMTGLTYDANSNLLTVQDARSVGTHAYTYDVRNRLKTYTDPNGNAQSYNYDASGNLSSTVDRKGQTTSYTYDGVNRLKTITYADNSTITLTWDAGSRPTQIVDTTNGTLTRQYDDLDRLKQEVSPQGQVNYNYDAAGRRTLFSVSGLTAVSYQYDNANRLTQVAQGATVVGMTYDAANRPQGITLPNGVVQTYSVDGANQLLALSYDKAGTHVGDLAYTYDQAGRRLTQSGSLAKLLIPGTVSATTYDAANRLTNWGGTQLSYDNNGNLSTLGSSTYTWNARDQLVATGDGGGEFSYDSFGRRTSRIVSGTTTPYLYDGGNAATAAGNFMLDGSGLDEIYAQVGSTATTSYVTDAIGSTVALTDSTGAIASSYSYEPYGADSRTGIADTPFQYSGRENDTDTNLYYYRARYYSPQLGRFISQDPLGLAGGLNTYAYAAGNPTLYRDPTGKFVWVIVGALVGAGTNLLIESSINGGQLTGDQVVAALVSGAISGAIGSLAGPVGGTVAKALTGRATGLLARLGVAAFSGGGAYAGQVAANAIDPCHTADPLVAAAFGAGGGFLGALFPTNTLNTIAQANYFAPKTIEGLFNSTNSAYYIGSLFTSGFAGAGANYY
jgi:RHS repeat-associated protein